MGQGYVGLPLAMAAIDAGHHVYGYELDEQRLQKLNLGASYVEDVPDKTLGAALATGRYVPTRTPGMLVDFDVAVITVPTPLKDRQPDLSYVVCATEILAPFVKPGATVILESTTHPGTTRTVVVPVLEKLTGWKAGEAFHVGFSPERIDPGNEQWTFTNTPKIVAGLTPACRDRVREFYAGITQRLVLADSVEEAELAKVFENTQRQVNIALVNELGRHAHTLGVDVHNVIELCATKPFGFTRYTPGPGVGGHCIPCDPVYLSEHLRREYGTRFRLVELAQEINDGQPAYVARRLQDALNRQGKALTSSRILALGQAYKPGTADTRESPAVEVVELLIELGADVEIVDPYLPQLTAADHHQVPEGLDTFDAVVLLTPHDEFDLQHIADRARFVLDTRGVMPVAPHIERL